MRYSLRRRALLLSAAFVFGPLAAAAQDLVVPLPPLPPDIARLFPPQPANEAPFGETVAAQAEARVAQGGAALAHVLLTLDEPLTPELTAQLEEQGLRIIDRFSEAIWIAEALPTGGLLAAAEEGPVGDLALIPPQAKLAATLSVENPQPGAMGEGGDLLVTVLVHKGVTPGEAAATLGEVGEVVSDAPLDPATFAFTRAVTVAIAAEALPELAGLDIVRFIEPASPPPEPHNQASTQPLSNVDDVQGPPYNLSGTGVRVGIWEADGTVTGATVRATHQDLTPRLTVQAGQAGGQTSHALHVAGTIGASGVNTAAAEGMAPAATLLSWDVQNDTGELATAAAAAAGANRIGVSNHSYGIGIGWNGAGTVFASQAGFGLYGTTSVAFDTIVAGDGIGTAGTEVVAVVSAGNDRNDGPGAGANPDDCNQGSLAFDADCLGPLATAKNVVTVGAMNGGAVIAGFSSYGPTDDGRIKPDVVANGVNVLSLGDQTGAQTDTGTFFNQGTSMAAPAVAGIVALMREQLTGLGIPTISAAAVKAILIQTARDVTGTGQATVGPDYATGWGIADAQAAIDLLRRPGGPGYAEGTLTATGGGGAWEFPFVVPAGTPELHVTLAWSDLAGPTNGGGVNFPAGPLAASTLVNDLDLRLVPPGGGTAQQPWTLAPLNPTAAAVRNGGDDARNNVEQVSVLSPAQGTWTARVTAKAGSLALGPQPFAIAGPITPDSGPIAGPKANIMMVLDKSGSMMLPAATAGLSKIQAMQNAARAFVDYIDLVGGHNVGLVAFDSAVAATSPGVPLALLDAASAGGARTAIGNLAPGGNTGIIAGVTEAVAQLAGPNATNPDDVVFLFSDGRHNTPSGSDVSVIDGLMAADTRFFSIGYGTDVDSTVMPGVAGNHDGVHLEEQGLQAGQLAKLFMVVGGLSADETIVIDPDYPLGNGASAVQEVLALREDHALTFTTFWNEPNAQKVAVQLFGPDKRCRVPMREHDGLAIRRGSNHALVRITLPYRCTTGAEGVDFMHEGPWRLQVRNIGSTADVAKVMVLADSGIGLEVRTEPKGKGALLTASLIEGGELLRKGVKIRAELRPNRPSSGDSGKEDQVVGNGPILTVTPGGGRGTIGGTIGGAVGGTVIGTIGGTVGGTIRGTTPGTTPGTTIRVPTTGATAGTTAGTVTRAPLPGLRGLEDGEAEPEADLIEVDPRLRDLLLERAQLLQLSPELLEQIRGRFVRVPTATGITLTDDGTGGDAKANDGVFSAFVSLPNAGLYQGRFVATQARPEGTMTREALGSVLVR